MLASITFQVLWGISYLKYEKRVHRVRAGRVPPATGSAAPDLVRRCRLSQDVKPQNILMHSSGAVKLTDFGISRVLEASIGARVRG